MLVIKTYKGIILAGGSGSRLHPATLALSKQLLPVYDKPMIYYPLSILMLAEIRQILIITTAQDCGRFKQLLGDGSQWGLELSYQVQQQPDGLAQAFILGEQFLNGAPACLVLGDNIFYGSGMTQLLKQAQAVTDGATVFAYQVADPERYGVVDFDAQHKALSLVEKPLVAKSNYAVTGLYFYDEKCSYYAKQLQPSARGELEITDLNKIYLARQQLNVVKLHRVFAWLDTGTHESLLEASQFIHTIEARQGIKIACLEEIALAKSWISISSVQQSLVGMGAGSYANYLRRLIKLEIF